MFHYMKVVFKIKIGSTDSRQFTLMFHCIIVILKLKVAGTDSTQFFCAYSIAWQTIG